MRFRVFTTLLWLVLAAPVWAQSPLSISASTPSAAVGQTYTVTGVVDKVAAGNNIHEYRLDGQGFFSCTATTCTKTLSYTQNTTGRTHTLTAKRLSDNTFWPSASVTVSVGPPPTCDPFSVSPTSQTVGASGGSVSVSVTGTSGCTRTATSNASWIAVTSGASGSGSGTVGLSVAANPVESVRTGTATIAAQTFTVTQDAAQPLPPGTAALDDFNRPDGLPGPNWAWKSSAPTIRGGSLGSTNTSLVIAWWTADTFAPDQFSEAVVSPGFTPADTYALQVFVRLQPQAHSTDVPWRYAFHYQPSTGQYTLKYDGGSPGIVLAETPGVQFVPGDVVRIEVQGSTIRGLLNGAVILTTTHTALTGGQAGLVINPLIGTSLQAFESWRGGPLP